MLGKPFPKGVLGLGSLSYALAIAVRKQNWMFWVVQQTLLFPLMILSGMLLPLETGPGWMQSASQVNPLTHLVNAERALFAGDLASPSVLWGWTASLALAAIGLVIGIRAMAHSAE
jgi:ABC-2 type transport system permease protein